MIRSHNFILLCLVLWLTFIACESNSDSKPKLDDATINNLTGSDTILNQFIPKPYNLLMYKKGDINGDQKDEVIMVLAQPEEAKQSNFENGKPSLRLFQIISFDENGTGTIIVQSNNVIECIDCSGYNGDAFKDIVLKPDGFDIKFGIMNQQYWDETKSFRYEKSVRDWKLMEDHYISYKSENPDQPNSVLTKGYEEHLTQKDFGKITITSFNIYDEDRR